MTKQSKTKIKVVNGVSYKMPKQDYDAISDWMKKIQEILARATIVENGRLIALVNANKETLTDDVKKRLFGDDYRKVCIYDNEAQTLRTKKYNGVMVRWNIPAQIASQTLKDLFDSRFSEFTLAYQVTKQVKDYWNDYWPWGEWTKTNESVKFDKDGMYTVGNLIVRNRKTGELRLLDEKRWLGVGYHVGKLDAAYKAAISFPEVVLDGPCLRKILAAGARLR